MPRVPFFQIRSKSRRIRRSISITSQWLLVGLGELSFQSILALVYRKRGDQFFCFLDNLGFLSGYSFNVFIDLISKH